MKYSIKLCNKVIAVNSNHGFARDYCNAFLSDLPPQYSIVVTFEDIAFELAKSIREDEIEGIAPRDYSDAYLETIALQRKVTECLFDHDTLLFHGSVVAVDGEGYLFTAKSGTGKSTHTRLWRQVFGKRAVMVNDDKPFLRMDEKGVTAYGSPWMGKHGLGANINVPLKGICILERGEENRIVQISAAQALPMLFQQSQRPQESRNLPKYMELVDKLASGTKFYRMQCNMDPEAAVIAYRTMSGKNE